LFFSPGEPRNSTNIGYCIAQKLTPEPLRTNPNARKYRFTAVFLVVG
jgi:hypothetical protein